MKVEHLQSKEPRWRTKLREAVEREADNILAVVGIIAAIYAWREWVIEERYEAVVAVLALSCEPGCSHEGEGRARREAYAKALAVWTAKVPDR